VTFKEIQHLLESQPDYTRSQQSEMLQRLRGKPFWLWDSTLHKEKGRTNKGDCCFNDIIGLPKKNGKRYPLFDYEKMLYMALVRPGYLNGKAAHPMSNTAARYRYDYRSSSSQYSRDLMSVLHGFKEKHLWVKKATGLGVTEFMLRFMAWLCVRDDRCEGSQMVIVTGPNQELAIKLIKRMKGLFARLGATFDSKETVLELNGCNIEAYPSNHIDAFRSLTNPKFILLDEGDFMPKFQQEDVRAVSERYIAKSDPFIVMVSTPNAPGGLFQRIEQEPFETCLYKKMFLDYAYGLDKIYTKTEIEKAKQSPSFPREYELQYLGLIGNIFSQVSIENATKIQYCPDNINPNAKKSIGVDAGFGSSKFAIVVTQFVDGKIQVIFAEEYERPNFAAMINRIWEIKQKCGYISNIYVDAANPEVWESLKREFNEPFNQQYIRDQITECRKYNLNIEDRMIVVPVPFSIEGAKMLQHAKWLMEETEEDGTSLIAIHKDRFHKLITSLRTAVANEYKLDKEQTSYNDILDAFRLSLVFYKRSKD
jgi:hypothetical protein